MERLHPSEYLANSTSGMDMLLGIIQTASLLKLQRVRSLPVYLDQGLVVHVIGSDLIWVPLLRPVVAGWLVLER